MEWIVGLLAGAVGGNAAGAAVSRINQGPIINSIAGIVGGGLGAQVLSMLGAGGMAADAAAGGVDIGALVAQVVSGGAGGGVVLAIVSVVRGMMNR
ncbi:MAG: hypothetical protein R3D60_12485 [Paracoccaceae bacterium]